jgi:hypothetical protein
MALLGLIAVLAQQPNGSSVDTSPCATAVRNWHFTPTVINGQPVSVRMTVTVNFTLR